MEHKKHYIFQVDFPGKQTKRKEENGPYPCRALQVIDKIMTNANSKTLASVSKRESLSLSLCVTFRFFWSREREGKRRGELY